MKKISTKIVLLSLINTLIVAILNVAASLYMNATQTMSAIGVENLPADAGGAGGAADGGLQASNNAISIPTPILYGLLGSLVLGVIVSYILGKFISKPIVKVTELTERLSRLELTRDAAYDELLKYRDETGAMSHALSNTRDALELMGSRLTSISGSVKLHAKDLSHSADNNVESVSQMVRTIDEVAHGNSNQAHSITEITSTLSEVTQLMNAAAAEARQNSNYAGQSFTMIEAGEKAVNTQVETMKDNIQVSQDTSRSIEELNVMIDKISDILTLITSITNQTNLLALNAAIESARAGEAGKGFAVVADEVRKLAEESASAAKSIVDIIKHIKDKSSNAVHQMNSSKALIDEQKQALGITQDAFSKIRNAYDIILKGFNQTAGAMETVNDKSTKIYEQIQDMAAVAQQTSASMEEVSASGQQQLASIEVVARSSKDLLNLSEELNTQTGLFVF